MLFWFYHASTLSVFIKPHGGFLNTCQAGRMPIKHMHWQTDRQATAKQYPTLIFFTVEPSLFFSILSLTLFFHLFACTLVFPRLPAFLSALARQCWLTLFSLSSSLSSYTLSSLLWDYLYSPSHFLWVTLASLPLSHPEMCGTEAGHFSLA